MSDEQEVVKETTAETVTERPAEPNSLGNVTEAVAGQPTEVTKEVVTETTKEPVEDSDED